MRGAARRARLGALALALGAAGVAMCGWDGADVRAQEAGDLRAVMEVDTTVIRLGDPVSVRVWVDHPADWTVLWPDSVDAAPFEVLAYAAAAPSPLPDDDGPDGPDGRDAPAGRARSAAELTVTSFELGELEIPPLEVPVRAPDGTVHALFTDPFGIGVETVGLDDSGDIRDIKGPLAIARNWWALLPWALLAAAAGAGAVYARRRFARRTAAAPIPRPKTPPRPFRVVALEALDELERSSLLERGEVKAWHVRVSEIIRAYVEGQLAVPALEMTTGEVAAGLRNAAMGTRITERFHAFLSRCDLVKFAKLRPGAEASRALLADARALVEMTSGAGADGAVEGAEPDGSIAEAGGP